MTDHDSVPDYDHDDEEPLPKRPRRRLVTPISATLAGALVAALGFIGGVEVQKGQDDGSTGNGANASALASAGGAGGSGAGGGRGGFNRGGGPQLGGGGPGGAAANATVGSVANKNGSTLYVKDSDGNLVRVKTTSHSKINRTASTSTGAIHPGDTIIVQGTTAKDGTVTATQVNATASGAASGLAGLFGAFGRGAGPQQAAPPGGG